MPQVNQVEAFVRSQVGRWVVGVSQMNLFQGKFRAGHLLDRQTDPPLSLLPLFFCTSLVMGDLRLSLLSVHNDSSAHLSIEAILATV